MSDAAKPAKVVVGTVFGRAMCDYLGLPVNQVEQDFYFHTGADEIFGVTLRVSLTADDMAGIADRMQRTTETMPTADASARSLGELKIVLDTQEAVDKIKAVLRDEYGAELIKPGELLALDPDPRLDEIIVLLKRLVRHADMSARSGSDGIKCHVGTMAPHGGLKPGKA